MEKGKLYRLKPNDEIVLIGFFVDLNSPDNIYENDIFMFLERKTLGRLLTSTILFKGKVGYIIMNKAVERNLERAY